MTVRLLPSGFHGRASSDCAVSYLDDGTQVVWEPEFGLAEDARIAIDAERFDRPVPPALRARACIAGRLEFYAAWTRVEVAAKLADVPVLEWLREEGWSDQVEGTYLATFRLGRLPTVVTLGISACDPPKSTFRFPEFALS